MLRYFYDVPDFAIMGAPEWFTSERYDITAQAAGNPSRDALKQMMRTTLAEQLQLVVHQEARSLPVFELRRSRADGSLGPNMVPAKINCEIGGTAACPHDLTSGSYMAVAMPMARIVRIRKHHRHPCRLRRNDEGAESFAKALYLTFGNLLIFGLVCCRHAALPSRHWRREADDCGRAVRSY